MNNLGTVCNLMGDYRAGIRYLTECLEQAKKETPDAYGELILYYINLADSYIHVDDNEKAVEVFREAEETAKKAGIISYECDYRLKYAVACYRLNDKKQGNMNFDKAVKLAAKMQDTFSDIEVFGDLTRILLQNKDIKRADKAVAIITEYGKTCSHTMDKLLVLSTLADYYKNTGDTMRAIGYYEQVEELYKDRTAELKQVQLGIHKSLKDADSSINKLNRMIRESEERASKDHMTKLLNHTAMLKVGGEFMNRAVKKKKKVGAIFIDIDCFKDCNDTYGHAKGDEIIKEVARACRAEESENVRFARYGGDEFIGLTYGLKDADLAEIAKKICLRVRKADIPNKMNPNGKRVTVSVGIANAAVTEKTDTVIQIINYADKAVYYSKKAGKNCIHLLDHDRTGINGEDAQFVRVDF
jgi:diguanylate cyclase (GGDEF)-like protein